MEFGALCVLFRLDFLEFCWFCYCWFCCLMVFDYFVIWVCVLVVCVVLVVYCVVWCLVLHKMEFWLSLGFRIGFGWFELRVLCLILINFWLFVCYGGSLSVFFC